MSCMKRRLAKKKKNSLVSGFNKRKTVLPWSWKAETDGEDFSWSNGQLASGRKCNIDKMMCMQLGKWSRGIYVAFAGIWKYLKTMLWTYFQNSFRNAPGISPSFSKCCHPCFWQTFRTCQPLLPCTKKDNEEMDREYGANRISKKVVEITFWVSRWCYDYSI